LGAPASATSALWRTGMGASALMLLSHLVAGTGNVRICRFRAVVR